MSRTLSLLVAVTFSPIIVCESTPQWGGSVLCVSSGVCRVGFAGLIIISYACVYLIVD